MAVKFQLVKGDVQFIPGLGDIRYGTSAFDPYMTVRIRCEKHPQYEIPVHNTSLLQEPFLDEAIYLALEKCPGCIESKQWETTKFPEGAEL